jgi:hypothetical protein
VSDQEAEVLWLVARGHPVEQIAARRGWLTAG